MLRPRALFGIRSLAIKGGFICLTAAAKSVQMMTFMNTPQLTLMYKYKVPGFNPFLKKKNKHCLSSNSKATAFNATSDLLCIYRTRII